MKKLFLPIIAIAFSAFAANAASIAPENYKLDPHHTSILWTSNHFGFSNPTGKFSEVEGDIVFNEKNPAESKVSVNIKMSNLFTGYTNFDNHLKSADFFNVEKYPTATFVSKKIKITGKNTAKITGDLTLMGVTKSVVLNANLNKIGVNPIVQRKTIGLTATATIKRSDFGISYALPAIADNVKLVIEAEGNLVEEVSPKK